jgi:hypothetical protein
MSSEIAVYNLPRIPGNQLGKWIYGDIFPVVETGDATLSKASIDQLRVLLGFPTYMGTNASGRKFCCKTTAEAATNIDPIASDGDIVYFIANTPASYTF